MFFEKIVTLYKMAINIKPQTSFSPLHSCQGCLCRSVCRAFCRRGCPSLRKGNGRGCRERRSRSRAPCSLLSVAGLPCGRCRRAERPSLTLDVRAFPASRAHACLRQRRLRRCVAAFSARVRNGT